LNRVALPVVAFVGLVGCAVNRSMDKRSSSRGTFVLLTSIRRRDKQWGRDTSFYIITSPINAEIGLIGSTVNDGLIDNSSSRIALVDGTGRRWRDADRSHHATSLRNASPFLTHIVFTCSTEVSRFGSVLALVIERVYRINDTGIISAGIFIIAISFNSTDNTRTYYVGFDVTILATESSASSVGRNWFSNVFTSSSWVAAVGEAEIS